MSKTGKIQNHQKIKKIIKKKQKPHSLASYIGTILFFIVHMGSIIARAPFMYVGTRMVSVGWFILYVSTRNPERATHSLQVHTYITAWSTEFNPLWWKRREEDSFSFLERFLFFCVCIGTSTCTYVSQSLVIVVRPRVCTWLYIYMYLSEPYTYIAAPFGIIQHLGKLIIILLYDTSYMIHTYLI